MSDGGGVSANQVYQIVRQVTDPLASRISGLEEEMGDVGRAVVELNNTLVEGVNRLLHQSEALIDRNDVLIQVERATQTITREQLTGLRSENATGFGAVAGRMEVVSDDLHAVDADVQKMTAAVVQMEVIRLLNEAKDPLERIKSFGDEIDQRFAKAVENVHFVRGQYDQLLATSAGDYDRKLHVIGEHIYHIYEDDFREFAEVPLATPPELHLEPVMAVGDRRLEARSAALDVDTAELGAKVLEPLLSAQREFEHTLAGTFATEITGLQGEFMLPAAIRIFEEDETLTLDVVAAASLSPIKNVAGEAGPAVTLRADPRGAQLAGIVRNALQPRLASIKTRPIRPDEVEEVKKALSEMVDPSLLGGYYDLLDLFGLEVVESAIATAPRRAEVGP